MKAIKEQIKAAEQRARSLKTKSAQTKAWKVVHELKHELFMLLAEERNKYATHSVKGTVIGDNSHCMSDYIMVKTEAYGILHASPTSDVLSKSWYAHTCCVEYSQGQEVILEC